eukprot:5585753-Pleurochrysis_carterae.AAC.1
MRTSKVHGTEEGSALYIICITVYWLSHAAIGDARNAQPSQVITEDWLHAETTRKQRKSVAYSQSQRFIAPPSSESGTTSLSPRRARLRTRPCSLRPDGDHATLRLCARSTIPLSARPGSRVGRDIVCELLHRRLSSDVLINASKELVEAGSKRACFVIYPFSKTTAQHIREMSSSDASQ